MFTVCMTWWTWTFMNDSFDGVGGKLLNFSAHIPCDILRHPQRICKEKILKRFLKLLILTRLSLSQLFYHPLTKQFPQSFLILEVKISCSTSPRPHFYHCKRKFLFFYSFIVFFSLTLNDMRWMWYSFSFNNEQNNEMTTTTSRMTTRK